MFLRYLYRNWYNIGGFVFLGVLVCCVLFWQDLGTLRGMLLLNFAGMLLHQYEEYGWPGGEPGVMNIALKKSNTPDSWPLNQKSAMITNVLCSYVFFLLPVFFPHAIWLGLAPMLAVFGQIVAHCIVNNRAMHTWYNPGMAAVLLWQLPLTVLYICYISINHLAGIGTWIFAVIYLVLYMFFFINKLTYSWLANKNGEYPFSTEEMRRYSSRWGNSSHP